MTLDDEKLVKGEQLRANVQRLEAEVDALHKQASETKSLPPELAIKTAEYMEAYKQEQDYKNEDVSPYSDY
ncbi:hypothetical protein ACET7A_06800 [Aeromonas veronii]